MDRNNVRPLVAFLRKFEVSVAEVGALELLGRAEIGVAVVASEAAHVREVLDTIEVKVKLAKDDPDFVITTFPDD